MSLTLSSIARTGTGQMFAGLERTLKKGAAHAKAKGVEDSVYLNWRIAPDMFPLKRQVEIGTEIAARGLSRLAGAAVPEFGGEDQSFDDLIAHIHKAQGVIASLDDAAIDADPDGDITVPMGPENTMTFQRALYVQRFILPNVTFHVSATYLILRHLGVDIGKRDFLAAPE